MEIGNHGHIQNSRNFGLLTPYGIKISNTALALSKYSSAYEFPELYNGSRDSLINHLINLAILLSENVMARREKITDKQDFLKLLINFVKVVGNV